MPADIILITETSLHNEILNEAVQISNYSIIRVDRNKQLTKKVKGGGVLAAVNNTTTSYNIKKLCCNEFERLDIVINKNNYKVFISLVYFPPRSKSKLYNEYLNDLISEIGSNKYNNYLIIGDFNLPGYKWVNLKKNSHFVGHNNNHDIRESAQSIFNFINDLNLQQLNEFINSSDNTLDLFLTRNECNIQVYETIDPLSLIDRFHSAHMIKFSINQINYHNKYRFNFNFNNGNYNKIIENLNEINWRDVKNKNNDPDKFLDFLYQILHINILNHVPKFKISQSKFPKFFSHELKVNINEKKRLNYYYKLTNNSIFKEMHSKVRIKCKEIRKRDYNSMINNVCVNSREEPKKLWNFVNTRNNDFPKTMNLNNQETSNDKEIAMMFSSHFKSVYTDSNKENYSLDININNNELTNIEVNQKDIFNALKNLKIHSSSGPDMINPIVVVKCIEGLIQPLLILFQLILSIGIYPKKFKEGFIIPIFKSGSKECISNYRPISIINVFSKLFEKILFEKLSVYLYKFIIPEQFGSMPGRSTVSNLLTFNEYVANAFCNGKSVQAVYLDIAKAFDTVDHSVLINKLEQYGIKGILLRLIKDYLTDRKQIVKFNNETSDSEFITSGVPQGSNLAPLFFITYINDISNVIKNCKFCPFIDDIKLFLEYSDINELQLLQSDLSRVEKWVQDNNFLLNIKKCCTMNYTQSVNPINNNISLNNTNLSNVSVINDLGIIFQHNLKFDQHIQNIIMKGTRKINYLKFKCKNIKNMSLLLILYNSMVKSCLMYGSIIW